MQSDDLIRTQKRLTELALRAERSSIYTFSPFLGAAEQDVFYRLVKQEIRTPVQAFGGVVGCERIMLRFGDPEDLGYEEPFPIQCLKATPVAPKFAEALTHRDVLGTLMHLGIERETLGDIVVREEGIYIFVQDKIAPYVLDQLTRVRHTDLRVELTDDLPEGALFRTEPHLLQAAGERLDAVIAKVYHLSRADAQALFHRGLVFVGGRQCESPSREPKPDETVSVRGYGRFIYRGPQSQTRKGKFNILVDVYV